jgi:hypothetical protein
MTTTSQAGPLPAALVIAGHVTGVTGQVASGQREVCLALAHASQGVTIPKYAPEFG